MCVYIYINHANMFKKKYLRKIINFSQLPVLVTDVIVLQFLFCR
jgi:hypothetical protein